MGTPRRGAPAAALLAAALLGSGCATPPPPGPRLQALLLLPANVVAPVPPGLEPGMPFVDTELRAYLESQARRVEALGPREARAVWLASARALRAEASDESQIGFEGAARLLAGRLRAERSFDAVVLPWVALRRARVRGRDVAWDGVERRLQVENPRQRSLSFLRDFTAEAAAPSIQVAVFSASGEKLCEGVGGLDLAHALVVEGEPPKVASQALPASRVFADRAPLREGIALAFESLLPLLAR
jgi:hypothetical protein